MSKNNNFYCNFLKLFLFDNIYNHEKNYFLFNYYISLLETRNSEINYCNKYYIYLIK